MLSKAQLVAILQKAQSLQARHGIAANSSGKGLISIDAVSLTAIPEGYVQSLAMHVAKPNGAPAQHPSWSNDWHKLLDNRQDDVQAALVHYLGDDDDLMPGKKNCSIKNALDRLNRLK